MIKGIFFDAAGVFYDRKPSSGEFVRKLLAQLGYPNKPAEPAIAQLRDWRLQATEGRLSYVEYWERFVEMHGVADANLRQTVVAQILDHAHCIFAYPGGRDAMAGLQARGFVLGIVTDTMYPAEWKRSWLRVAGVDDFFSVFTSSAVLGAHKPEPAMYLDAIRQAGLSPDVSAFVGHAADELAGARAAGLATVAVNYEPDAQADYYARTLIDLLNVPIFQK